MSVASRYHSSCTYSNEPPFDRHDWIIRRPKTGEEVRYVIDYYSAPPEPDGSPVFSLDVRPALDSFSSLKERIAVATEEVWAAAREKTKTTDAGSSLRRES
jgi:cytochrome c heme-lyase